ncbi:PD40 domain-containing protein [Candidatus Woesearchaeota archaeon]|nr:PD40 domain-containing protein [Candidatus Woesearchaeota archaeon]
MPFDRGLADVVRELASQGFSRQDRRLILEDEHFDANVFWQQIGFINDSNKATKEKNQPNIQDYFPGLENGKPSDYVFGPNGRILGAHSVDASHYIRKVWGDFSPDITLSPAKVFGLGIAGLAAGFFPTHSTSTDVQNPNYQSSGFDFGKLLSAVGNFSFVSNAYGQDLRDTKIAFVSNRSGNYEIYVMNPDGSNQVNITNNSREDNLPSWSPTGEKIAFVSYRDSDFEIYTMNMDGTGQTRLTTNNGYDLYPAWTLEGRIAFISDRDSRGSGFKIYIMDADGNNVSMIPNSPNVYYDFSLSPEGRRVAFGSTKDDSNGEIYTTWTHSGNITTRLTFNSLYDSSPAWSPNGNSILFVSRTRVSSNSNDQIYAVGAYGGVPINLSSNTFSDGDPAWSPDGRQIAFKSNRDGAAEIYKMNADGSSQVRLTNNSAIDTYPSWSPLLTGTLPPPNNPPQFSSIADKRIDEGQTLEFAVNASDADGDRVTISAQNPPRGANFSNNMFVWTPDFEQAGNYRITFRATDGKDNVSTSVTVRVDDVPSRGISGTIYSDVNGAAVRNAVVELNNMQSLRDTTDSNGNFNFVFNRESEVLSPARNFTPGKLKVYLPGSQDSVVTTAHYSLDDFRSGKSLEQLIYVVNAPMWNNSHEKQFYFLEPPKEIHSERQPVLLVHGLNGTSGYWANIPEALSDRGYDVWVLGYPTQSIRESAALLGRPIGVVRGNYNGKKIHVAAHSKGGLVVRAYTTWDRNNDNQPDFYGNDIESFLMLGTPNHGSEAAGKIGRGELNFARILTWARGQNPDAPAYDELSPGSEFMWELDEYGVNKSILRQAVIAGTRGISYLPHMEARNHDDGVVAISSASLLEYGIPLGLLDLNHAELIGQSPLGSWESKDSRTVQRITRLISDWVKDDPITSDVNIYVDPSMYSDGVIPNLEIGDILNYGIFQARINNASGDFTIRPPRTTRRATLPKLQYNSSSGNYYYYDERITANGNVTQPIADYFFGNGLALPAGETFTLVRNGVDLWTFKLKPLEALMAELNFVSPYSGTDVSADDEKLLLWYYI